MPKQRLIYLLSHSPPTASNTLDISFSMNGTVTYCSTMDASISFILTTLDFLLAENSVLTIFAHEVLPYLLVKSYLLITIPSPASASLACKKLHLSM